jgi:hypothetical protein
MRLVLIMWIQPALIATCVEAPHPACLRVCFKNPERTHFLGDSIGLAGKKAHENEISY